MSTPSNNRQMHNDIMAAGSRERPPMLAPGHYAQWSSRFMRYVDTKANKNELRHYIEKGPYILIELVTEAVPAVGDESGQPHRVQEETYVNTTPENRRLIDAEAEAMHMILNEIGDDIYSTMDACFTTRKCGLLLNDCNKESLSTNKIFYKMMNEMVRNKLKADTMQVNVQFLQQLQPEWSRFVTIVKQQQDLDTLSYHTLFDILKQHQNETLTLQILTSTKTSQNPYIILKTHNINQFSCNYQKQRQRDCLNKLHHPLSLLLKKTVNPENGSKTDNDMPRKKLSTHCKVHQNIYKHTKNNHRTSSNTRNKTVDTSPRFGNDIKTGQFGNEMTVTVAGAREKNRKAKRGKYYEYHEEKMMLCNQDSKGVPLSAEQEDWLHDTNDEPDEQESKAHYMYMAMIQEVPTTDSGPTYDVEPLENVHSADNYNVLPLTALLSTESINDTYVVETIDSNVTPDSSYMCDNEGQADQNAKNTKDERVFLASLIANLKLDIDENKKSQKQLKKVNTELEKYKILQTNHKDKEKVELEYAKALGLLEETKRLHNESSKTQSYTTFCVKEENSKLVNQISAHESKISQMLKEKEQMKKDFKER
ncbi:hypothetical protein Tco_1021899 [Tanacetum coccineum]